MQHPVIAPVAEVLMLMPDAEAQTCRLPDVEALMFVDAVYHVYVHAGFIGHIVVIDVLFS